MFDFTFQQFLLRFFAVMLTVGVHGFALALAAHALGDIGPRADKRLTLNPLVHMDIVGTLLMWLLSIGWAKWLRVDAPEVRGRGWGLALVALSGMLGNVLLIVVLAWARPHVLSVLPTTVGFTAVSFMNTTITMNTWFLLYNALPLPPLTGFRFVEAIVPSARPIKAGPWYAVLLHVALIVSGVAATVLGPAQTLLRHVLPG